MPQGDAVQLLLIDLRPRPSRAAPGVEPVTDELLVRYRRDLTVLDCSESYAQFYGRRRVDMIGGNFADWLPANELEIVRRALSEAGARTILNTNQIAKTQSDGSQRWYRWIDFALPKDRARPPSSCRSASM